MSIDNTLIQTSTWEQVARLLEGAKQQAGERRHALLASFSLPFDPTEMQYLHPTNGAPYFLWEQPDRNVSLYALGEALRIEAQGEGRFARLKHDLAAVLDEAIVEDTTGQERGPVCLAGFAFDPVRPREPAWQDFPDGLVVIPRLLFSRCDEEASLIMNVQVDGNCDVGHEVQALQNEFAGAFGAVQPLERASLLAGEEDGRDAWSDSVLALTRQIEFQCVEKVVLARQLRVSSDEPFNIAASLERLRQRFPDCTIFAVGQGDSCFLGATPELLVRREGERVRTDCLAGSARRGRSVEEDAAIGAALLADEKERREHALVAQGLRQSLAELCGDLHLPATPTLRKMANVQHLYTPVEALARGDHHILDFVERLHPTPAVAGLPRERSLCLIREREQFSRGWYAGPLGWLDGRGDGEFAVALRSALVRGNEALLYAGCGIVAGSDPDREYAESSLKLEAMRWALAGTS